MGDETKIPKFRGLQDNFLFWAARIEAIMEEKECVRALSFAALPTSDEDRKMAAKACSIILRGLSDVPFSVVRRHLKDPTAMWTALHERYASDSTFTKASVQTKLARMRYDEEAMDLYVHEFEMMAAQLESMNAALDEGMLVTMFLESFGLRSASEYGSTIAALQTREDLTWAQASSRMLQEYQSLVANTNGSMGLEKPKVERALNAPEFKGTCFYCKEPGHKKLQCPKLKRDGYRGRGRRGRYRGRGGAFTARYQRDTREREVKFALMDSGATSHMVQDLNLLRNKGAEKRTIATAGDAVLKSEVGGTMKISMGDGMPTMALSHALHVPKVKDNLMSVSALCDEGMRVTFDKASCKITKDGDIVGECKREGNVYVVPLVPGGETASPARAAGKNIDLWHYRLAHADKRAVKRLAEEKIVEGIDLKRNNGGVDVPNCSPCMAGKTASGSMKGRTRLSKVPGERIHTDVCPVNVTSEGGANYIVSFVDEASGYVEAVPVARKGEAAPQLKKFVSWMERQTGRLIKSVTVDGGGEYEKALVPLSNGGIEVYESAPYTSEENGRAERMNRTLMNCIRASLRHSGLPDKYWAECLGSVVDARNHVPKAGCKVAPIELVKGTRASVIHLRVFGALAWTRVSDKVRKKLDAKAKRGIVMRSISHGKYRVYIPHENKFVISRHVTIDESIYPAKKWRNGRTDDPEYGDMADFHWNPDDEGDETPGKRTDEPAKSVRFELENEKVVSPRDDDVEGAQGVDNDEGTQGSAGTNGQALLGPWNEAHNEQVQREALDENEDDDMAQVKAPPGNNAERNTRYPARNRKAPVRYHDAASLALEDDTLDYKTAMSGEEAHEWEEALANEIASIEGNNTWERADVPKERKALSTKVIFKKKFNADGTVSRYKARLVVRGFEQKYGVDFLETYAPVPDYDDIIAIIALFVSRGARIDMVDFVSAFLNGDVQEEVYITLPKEMDGTGKTYKLLKSLYGLKQSPRNWFKKLGETLRSKGFKPLGTTCCTYVRYTGEEQVVIIAYVDDIVIMSMNNEKVDEVKKELGILFPITDLGKLHQLLAVKFERSQDGRKFKLTQRAYTKRVLRRFGMENCTPVRTPMMENYHAMVGCVSPTDEDRKQVAKVPYREVLGSLLYLARRTRPDISLAVGILCRSSHDPTMGQWMSVLRILRYLKGTLEYGVFIGGTPVKERKVHIEAYTDADWAGDRTDRRSTSGYILLMNGGALSWASMKQKCTALSSTEAEYVGLSECCRAIARVRNLFVELGFTIPPVLLHEDNQSCTAWIKASTKYAKHIDIRYHYARHLHDDGTIDVHYCKTSDMLADLMTKPLGRVLYEGLVKHEKMPMVVVEGTEGTASKEEC